MREFSVPRIFSLVRNRLFSDLTPIILGAGVLLGLNILINLMSLVLTGSFPPPQNEGQQWIVLAVFVCFLTSARAFRDMQSAKSATEWLLLPATTTEKYLAVLLVSQVVVPVVSALLGLLLWALSGPVILPPALGSWELWGLFAVVNLLLMTGSTVYRKIAGIKTMGTLIGFGIVLAFVAALGLRLLGISNEGSIEFGPGMDESGWTLNGHTPGSGVETFLKWFWMFGVYVFTPVAAVAFGFFRVKEKEARDAVQ